MLLPNAEHAVVDIRKLRDYCLHSTHAANTKPECLNLRWDVLKTMPNGYARNCSPPFNRKVPSGSSRMNTARGIESISKGAPLIPRDHSQRLDRPLR